MIDYHRRPIPSETVRSFMRDLVRDRRWLLRRVDTVEFLDAESTVRKSTFDVDTRWISNKQPVGFVRGDFAIVPLTMMRKTLLSDSDLRDASGAALSIAERPLDSYLSWAALLGRSDEAGIPLAATPNVAHHVRRTIESFPLSDRIDLYRHQPSWDRETHVDWSTSDFEVWKQFLDSPPLRRFFWDLTYDFFLVTFLPIQPQPSVVKFSSRQEFSFSKDGGWTGAALSALNIRPWVLEVQMPAPSQARRSHLRIAIPVADGLEWRSINVVRQLPESYRPEKLTRREKRAERRDTPQAGSLNPEDHCTVALTRSRAHVYVDTGNTQHPLKARASLFVPCHGFLRAAMLASAFTSLILLAGIELRSLLEQSLSQNLDAAVAILLLAPSLLTSFLIRPGEHMLLSKFLRFLRFLLVGSIAFDFAATAGTVLYLAQVKSGSTRIWSDIWNGSFIGATVIAGVILLAYVASRLRSWRGPKSDAPYQCIIGKVYVAEPSSAAAFEEPSNPSTAVSAG